jgi:hypothetical protein
MVYGVHNSTLAHEQGIDRYRQDRKDRDTIREETRRDEKRRDKTRQDETTTYTGPGPSVVMMGLRPSFFLFLLATEAEAELLPFPFAPAIKGTVVEDMAGDMAGDMVGDTVGDTVGGSAVALTASTFAVVADLHMEAVAGVGACSEFVASFEPFIFATLRQTKL